MTQVRCPFPQACKNVMTILLDVVMWDSHPLSLGATPAQVFIDGIPQLKDPHVLHKPDGLQRSPRTPNFDREARETVEFDGLPPLRRHHRFVNGEIIKLVNVSTVWAMNDMNDYHPSLDDTVPGASHDVFLQDGTVICVTKMGSRCDVNGDLSTQAIHEINLQGGALLPGLVSFGAPLGLEEIAQEPSTNDGSVPDALTGSVPAIAGGTNAIIRAVDGLAFNGRNLLYVLPSSLLPLQTSHYVGMHTVMVSLKQSPHPLEGDLSRVFQQKFSLGQRMLFSVEPFYKRRPRFILRSVTVSMQVLVRRLQRFDNSCCNRIPRHGSVSARRVNVYFVGTYL